MDKMRKGERVVLQSNLPPWYSVKPKIGSEAMIAKNQRSAYYVNIEWTDGKNKKADGKYPASYFMSLGRTWNERLNVRGR